MQAEPTKRGQAAQGAQAGLATISGNVLSLDDVIHHDTRSLITKIAGDALAGPTNDPRKKPSVTQLLERFER